MRDGDGSDRSFAPLSVEHLERLAGIARLDRESMFTKNPHLECYRDRVLLVALCQGAAMHYLDGETGVKDFDVYTFYADMPGIMLHPRRHGTADFGKSEFGYWIHEKPIRGQRFVGRRVDLLQRALKVSPTADPVDAVHQWLRRKNGTPAWLRKKAVIGIWPDNHLGRVVWPIQGG